MPPLNLLLIAFADAFATAKASGNRMLSISSATEMRGLLSGLEITLKPGTQLSPIALEFLNSLQPPAPSTGDAPAAEMPVATAPATPAKKAKTKASA